MKKPKYEIKKQQILPGFEAGRYEPRRQYDHAEFTSSFGDLMKRDNRINIKVSGNDLAELKQESLTRGIPLQTLLADIIHRYVLAGGNRSSADLTGQQPLVTPAKPDLASPELHPSLQKDN